MGFSLKANGKMISTSSSPDRDQQFWIIKQLRTSFATAGQPVICVDTKKKELIGQFALTGRVRTREPIAPMIMISATTLWRSRDLGSYAREGTAERKMRPADRLDSFAATSSATGSTYGLCC